MHGDVGKRFYEKDGVTFNKKGKEFAEIVRNHVTTHHYDKLYEYEQKAHSITSGPNPRADRWIRQIDKDWAEHEKAEKMFEQTGDKQYEIKSKESLEKYHYHNILLEASLRYDTDRVYNEFLSEIIPRIAIYYDHDYSRGGEVFVSKALGNYYKVDLD